MKDLALSFAEFILPIADGIGDVASYGWDIVVRQQYAYGVVLIVITILSVLEALAGIYAIKYANSQPMNRVSRYGEIKDVMYPKWAWLSFFGYVSQINWLTAKFSLVAGILYLYNPEFFAIQFLAQLTSVVTQ
jgi:hypothetical protein